MRQRLNRTNSEEEEDVSVSSVMRLLRQRNQVASRINQNLLILAGSRYSNANRNRSNVQAISRLPPVIEVELDYSTAGQGLRTRSGVEYQIGNEDDVEEYEPQSDVSDDLSDIDNSSDEEYADEESEEEPHRPWSQPDDDSDNEVDNNFDDAQFEMRMEQVEELRKQKRVATMSKYLLHPPSQTHRAKNAAATSQIPTSLVCPITTLPFEDPVVACDGHTYERNAIITWLASNNKSPMTGKRMQSLALYSNMALRAVQDDLIASSRSAHA